LHEKGSFKRDDVDDLVSFELFEMEVASKLALADGREGSLWELINSFDPNRFLCHEQVWIGF
jgi:hypothetical protein